MFGPRGASQADVKSITYKTIWVRVLFAIIKDRLGESNNHFSKAYLEFGALENSIKHTEIKERDVIPMSREIEKAGLIVVDLLTETEKEYTKLLFM